MNFRNTLQKSLIFDNLSHRFDHPTASEIYDDLKEQGVGIATIYRNLNLLVDEGKVIKIIDDKHISHFDIVMNKHCHFVCKNCGEIIDISPKMIFRDDMKMKVDYNNIVLSGICEKCLKKGK